MAALEAGDAAATARKAALAALAAERATMEKAMASQGERLKAAEVSSITCSRFYQPLLTFNHARFCQSFFSLPLLPNTHALFNHVLIYQSLLALPCLCSILLILSSLLYFLTLGGVGGARAGEAKVKGGNGGNGGSAAGATDTVING
jgi:hypothetical protein